VNLLSICNQEVAKEHADENPLERWRLYGSIHNPHIQASPPKKRCIVTNCLQRRTAKFAPAAAPVASKLAPKIEAKPSAAVTSKDKEKAAPARRGSASEDNVSGRSTPQPTTAANTLKKSESKASLRRENSDLFKSFAKAKPKARDQDKSKESTPAPVEDGMPLLFLSFFLLTAAEPMQGMSEDEGNDDDAPEVKFDEEKAAEARKAAAERKKQLESLFDDG
jgi:DNA polymerase delta subunit 3